MPGGLARNVVRWLVVAALCAAFMGSVLAPVPEALPTVAIGQVALYRLEIALLIFYGSLLLITPAFSALAWGRLPTEISTRGARFAEKADQSVERVEAAVRAMEQTNVSLAEGLKTARIEIRLLREANHRDNTQLEVDSKR